MRENEKKKSLLKSDILKNHFESNPKDLKLKSKIEEMNFKLESVFPQFKTIGILPD